MFTVHVQHSDIEVTQAPVTLTRRVLTCILFAANENQVTVHYSMSGGGPENLTPRETMGLEDRPMKSKSRNGGFLPLHLLLMLCRTTDRDLSGIGEQSSIPEHSSMNIDSVCRYQFLDKLCVNLPIVRGRTRIAAQRPNLPSSDQGGVDHE